MSKYRFKLNIGNYLLFGLGCGILLVFVPIFAVLLAYFQRNSNSTATPTILIIFSLLAICSILVYIFIFLKQGVRWGYIEGDNIIIRWPFGVVKKMNFNEVLQIKTSNLNKYRNQNDDIYILIIYSDENIKKPDYLMKEDTYITLLYDKKDYEYLLSIWKK